MPGAPQQARRRLPGIFEDYDLVGPEDDALQEMARSMRERHS
jgi:hypothetical protein